MKKATILFALTLIVSSAFSQTAYEDAVQLRSRIVWIYTWHQTSTDTAVLPTSIDYALAPYPVGYHRNDTIINKSSIHYTTYDTPKIGFSSGTDSYSLVKTILKFYSLHPDSSKWSDIKPDYKANDFINPYIANGSVAGANNVGTLGGLLGGFSATNLVDGLSEFLIERGKAEINEAFFIRLKGFLNNYPEFAMLFPNTNTFLSSYNSWEYSNLLNTLKEAFNKDIKQLPADIVKLRFIDSSGCPLDKKNKPNQACSDRIATLQKFFISNEGVLLFSACKVADGVLQNKKLPEIINSITTKDFLLGYALKDTVAQRNLINGFQLINVMNLSLESNDVGRNYITMDQFNSLKTDAILKNLYLGLLLQELRKGNDNKGIQFIIGKDTIKLAKLLTSKHIDGVLNYLNGVIQQAKNLQTIADQLRADQLAAKADLSPDYVALISGVQQMLAALNNIGMIDPQVSLPSDIKTYYDYTNKALQVSNDILAKNFNAAVMTTLDMITDLIKLQKNTDSKLADFCASFLKYASFASNVVQAKTPDDVKAAIEAVALPVGSYTVKQKSTFNISVNAYVGYAWDFEKFPPSNLYAHGVYAPIGFSFNWGTARPNGVPVSLFASVIDLGSFVSYNLQKTSTDQLKQDVRLESVFSPSIEFLLSFPHTPLSAGFGWRQTPKLFYTASDNSFVPVKSQSVFNISVLIDIPLFTVHNVPFTTTKN